MTLESLPAWDLAALSELVYAPWLEVERGLDALGADLVATWDKRGTQGMLTQTRRMDGSPAFAAITFRGTETQGSAILIDLWRNLTWPWPVAWMGPGRCHAGYRNALAAIAWPAAEAAKRVPSEIPLYICGHSAGGSIGTAFAAWYAETFPNWKLAGVVSFGAPKALDATAAAAVRCPVHRYVMPGDPFPYWPPVRGLVHASPAIRLTPPDRWPGPLSRHDAGGYRRALEKAAA